MYTGIRSIQAIIHENFRQYASRDAISFGSEKRTYQELEWSIEKMIGYIESENIREGDHVGVVMEKGIDSVIVILGLLFSKAIFVPADASLPAERIMDLLRSADVQHVFFQSENTDLKNTLSALGRIHEPDLSFRKHGMTAFKEDTFLPDAPVYMFFTSGTEGIPKGVLGKNAGLAHFIDWEINTLQLTPGTRVSFISSPGFDASLRDMFLPLCLGGTLCIPPSREYILNGEMLVEWLEHERVNVVHCVPGIFRNIGSSALSENSLPDLQFILMAGERIIPAELQKWYNVIDKRIQLINLYGATEVTMAKTFYFITPEDVRRKSIPVGKPMEGASLLVLNEQLEPCSLMEEGDLYIRTRYSTLGYYKSPELNAAKFIPDPFPGYHAELLYRTGDTGKCRPDGNYEFIGRRDGLLKIRGNRVDPLEIENYVIRHENIQKCVIVPREEDDHTELCLYVVCREPMDMRSLREYLEAVLPAYMVPKYINGIERMPLTVNGKIDISALPQPVIVTTMVVTPVNMYEERVRKIWAKMLKVNEENISTEARFFELGGNSLSLMNMISVICKEMDVRIPLGAVLKNATIKHIASLISTHSSSQLKPILPSGKREWYELSAPQARLFVTALMNKDVQAYNMFMTFLIEDTFSMEVVQDAFCMLIARHESLRTSFNIFDGKPVQIIHEHLPFRVALLTDDIGFVAPFDLYNAPLIRVGYLPQPAEGNVKLLVDMHHIISDGASLEILKREFFEILNGRILTMPALQYRDYALWSNQHLSGLEIEKQREYWTNEFRTAPPALGINMGEADHVATGSKVKFLFFEEHITASINDFVKYNNTTLSVFLLTVYKLLLYKYTGNTDIVVGMSVHGRTHPDTSDMVGFFVNMLPVRTLLMTGDTLDAFRKQVHEKCMRAYENQEYDYTTIPGREQRRQLIETVFTMQDTVQVDYSDTAMQEEIVHYPDVDAKYDIFLDAFTDKKTAALRFTFSPHVLSDKMINAMAHSFNEIVLQCLENKESIVADMVFSSNEKTFIDSFDFSN